jgi:succinate dehydrogenase / fumarate reductase flavoprotein subunit
VHGGNRLGANSLLDTLIFGRRSGEHAAERASAMSMPRPVRRLAARRAAGDRPDPPSRARRPPDLGDQGRARDDDEREGRGLPRRGRPHAGARDDPRLKEEASVAAIDDHGTVFNQDVLGAIELGYMLDVPSASSSGALERSESRGAQFRLDFPQRDDDEWAEAHHALRERRAAFPRSPTPRSP